MMRWLMGALVLSTMSTAAAAPPAKDLAPPKEWRIGEEVLSADQLQQVTTSTLMLTPGDGEEVLDRAVEQLRDVLVQSLPMSFGAVKKTRKGTDLLAEWSGVRKGQALWFGAILRRGIARSQGLAFMYSDKRVPLDLARTQAAGNRLFTAFAGADPGLLTAPAPSVDPPRFTDNAARELRRRVASPDDVVWVGADHAGSSYTYVVEIRKASVLPSDAVRYLASDLRCAMDARTVPVLTRAKIDYVAGKGFKVDNPNVK